MIHQARFVNFKCLADVELEELGEFATFVGPNGSGKTSILEGLHYISQLGSKKPSKLFVGRREPETLLRRGAKRPDFEIQVEGEWNNRSGELWVELGQANDSTPDSSYKFEFGAEFEGGLVQVPKDASLTHRAETRDIGYAVDSAVLLRLNPERLAEPSYSEEETPRVEYDGEGLATVLREMQANRPEAFDKLIDSLRTVVPVVDGVRTRRAPVWKTKTREITVNGESFTRQESEKFMGEEVVFDMKGATDIPAHAVSEGTLLVLGLLAVIINERRPGLLLLDDIEQSLHPKALGDLVGTLRKLLQEYSGLQILATSHSPYLLDHLDGDEVWLTKLNSDGSTVARRLDTHPQYEEWRSEMTTGEFWSYVGEDWMI